MTLRVEPIDAAGTEHSVLDEQGQEVAVVTGSRELALQMAAGPAVVNAFRDLLDAIDSAEGKQP